MSAPRDAGTVAVEPACETVISRQWAFCNPDSGDEFPQLRVLKAASSARATAARRRTDV
jgi:hypothetical protein